MKVLISAFLTPENQVDYAAFVEEITTGDNYEPDSTGTNEKAPIVPPPKRAILEAEDILDMLRKKVSRHRINPLDFFKDFDPLGFLKLNCVDLKFRQRKNSATEIPLRLRIVCVFSFSRRT